VRFQGQLCTSGELRPKLAALIETFFRIGGMQMQINTLSSDTLVDAIRNPRNYPDLVVRVAGFSAYFTTLDPAIQRNIVDRAIYELN
jgi:pyruvate-formate lyase